MSDAISHCLECGLFVTGPCSWKGCELRPLENGGDSFSNADGALAVLDFGTIHSPTSSSEASHDGM